LSDEEEILEDMRKSCELFAKLNESPKKRKTLKIPKTSEINRYDIWINNFTEVVYLDENMRFLNDPEWGREHAKTRKGIWTKEMIEIINGRLLNINQTLILNSVDIQSYLTDTNVYMNAIRQKHQVP